MKKLAMFIFALCLATSVFASAGWMTDMDKAMKLSAETGKPILADFSGSDWCGWCIKLDKEVFSKKIFKDFAKDNLILVMLDFPRSKPMSAKLKKQNSALASKYGVRGYPTVLLLDNKGKVIVKTGYRRGGPQAYVNFLKTKMPAIKAGKTKKKTKIKKMKPLIVIK
jgi:thioredoxin-related protein